MFLKCDIFLKKLELYSQILTCTSYCFPCFMTFSQNISTIFCKSQIFSSSVQEIIFVCNRGTRRIHFSLGRGEKPQTGLNANIFQVLTFMPVVFIHVGVFHVSIKEISYFGFSTETANDNRPTSQSLIITDVTVTIQFVSHTHKNTLTHRGGGWEEENQNQGEGGVCCDRRAGLYVSHSWSLK